MTNPTTRDRGLFRRRLRAGALGLSLLAAAACASTESGIAPTATGTTTTTTKPPLDETPLEPAIAAKTGAPRLTVAQYRSAIRELFGEKVTPPVALEPDQVLGGFVAIGASESAVSSRGVEQYETAAFDVAKQALADAATRKAVVPCEPAKVDDRACAEKLAATLGRRVFRRPLDADEVARVADVTVKAALALDDFHQGAEFGIATLLQSPSFLYRPTVGEPDPKSPGATRATGYELATKLSFFLWNGIPDEELLEAAENGALHTDEGLAAQVKRLLASPKAKDGLRNFVTEWLRLDELDTLDKDPMVYTTYSPDLGPSAREETLRLFEWITFEERGDFRDVLTTRHTFVDPLLAALYHVPAPVAAGFAPIDFPADGPRRGLLGQASFLALQSHPTTTSATLRGKFLRTQLLCQPIPPPPVNVNTALPEPSDQAKTLRDRVKIHLEDEFCASCHAKMDPLGLAFEHFDGVGEYRKTDRGAAIDTAGDLDGVPFADPRALEDELRDHAALAPCFARKVYEYATGFREESAEEPVIAALTERFRASGHRVEDLLFAVATSRGFRLVGASR